MFKVVKKKDNSKTGKKSKTQGDKTEKNLKTESPTDDPAIKDKQTSEKDTKRSLLNRYPKIKKYKYCEQSYICRNLAEHYCKEENMLFCRFGIENNHSLCQEPKKFTQPSKIYQDLSHQENMLFLLEERLRDLDPPHSSKNLAKLMQYDDLAKNFDLLNKKVEKLIKYVEDCDWGAYISFCEDGKQSQSNLFNTSGFLTIPQDHLKYEALLMLDYHSPRSQDSTITDNSLVLNFADLRNYGIQSNRLKIRELEHLDEVNKYKEEIKNLQEDNHDFKEIIKDHNKTIDEQKVELQKHEQTI